MRIRDMIAAVAAETGWSESGQASALIDFLDELSREDETVAGRLRAFLRARVESEGDEEVDLLAGSRLPWAGRPDGR